MNRTCKEIFRSLLRARDGSVLALVTVSALLLVIAVGAAIDGQRVQQLHAKIQSSLDAAGLAVAKNANTYGGITSASATNLAQQYFDLNFPQGSLASTPITVTATVSGNTISLIANTNQTMSLMQVAGQPSMPVGAASVVQFGSISNPQCGLNSILGQCNVGTSSVSSGSWVSDTHGTTPPPLSTMGEWTCTNAGQKQYCYLPIPQCGTSAGSCTAGINPAGAGTTSNAGTNTTWSCILNGGTVGCSDVDPQCGPNPPSINWCPNGSSPNILPSSGNNAFWDCYNSSTNTTGSTCNLPFTQCGPTVNTCTNGIAATGPMINNGTSTSWWCDLNGLNTSCSDADPTCGGTINTCSNGSTAISQNTIGNTAYWYCQNNGTKAVNTSQCSALLPQCGTSAGSCISPATNSGNPATSNNGSNTTWSCTLNGYTQSCTDADPQCSATTIDGCSAGSTATNQSTSLNGSIAYWYCYNSSTSITSSQCSLATTQCGPTINTCTNGVTATGQSNNGTNSTWWCDLNGLNTSCTDADPTCNNTVKNGCSPSTGTIAINQSTSGNTATWNCENTSTLATSSQCSITTQCSTVSDGVGAAAYEYPLYGNYTSNYNGLTYGNFQAQYILGNNYPQYGDCDTDGWCGEQYIPPSFCSRTKLATITSGITSINIPQQSWQTTLLSGLNQSYLEGYVVDFYGTFTVCTAGTYTFQVNVDDAAILYIDGALVTDTAQANAMNMVSGWHGATISDYMTAGTHTFRLIYGQMPRQYDGLQFLWQPPGATGFTAVPLSAPIGSQNAGGCSSVPEAFWCQANPVWGLQTEGWSRTPTAINCALTYGKQSNFYVNGNATGYSVNASNVSSGSVCGPDLAAQGLSYQDVQQCICLEATPPSSYMSSSFTNQNGNLSTTQWNDIKNCSYPSGWSR